MLHGVWGFAVGCSVYRAPICDCPSDTPGHAVDIDGVCSCLPTPVEPEGEAPTATFFVDADASGGDGSATAPWAQPDWSAIDDALGEGPVHVVFDAEDTFPERLEVLRTDAGPHRLTLIGRNGSGQRARVPGIHTTYEAIPRHRVTVSGFEVVGSRDKGIYWVGGDGVVLYDNVVHGNGRSPSINIEYSNRTGLASDGIRIVGNHVYDQIGECIYVGGSEGLDESSHANVEVSHNLVHGCRHPFNTRSDGINIKDRISDVVVRRNVVIGGDWGIEVASAGVYEGNLTIDADREGFHVSDGFQALPDMVFRNNVSIGAGDEGFQLTADRAPTGDILVEGLTVLDARDRGVAIGGSFDVLARFERVAVQRTPVAFDGWGQGDVQVGVCTTVDADLDFDRQFEGQAPCDAGTVVPEGPVAGADGIFFTDDDPWLAAGGARL